MFRLLLLCALTVLLHNGVDAQIDPRGMYFMRNTQFGTPTSFTEWFSVRPIAGTNQYSLRDFFGYGWNGTILPDGTITLVGGAPGSFSTPDDFSTEVGAGPGNLYNCNRCPGTDVDFPVLFPGTPVVGDVARNGDYDGTVEVINAETELVVNVVPRVVTLEVTGNKLRLTLDNGVFYEGLFTNDGSVAIRVVENTVTGWVPLYASYAATTTNIPLDVVGTVTFDDEDSFTAILCRQTRASIGTQSQSLHRISGTRIVTGGMQIPGDFDQSGDFDIGDAVSFLGFLFSTGTADLPCASGAVDAGGNLLLLDASGDDSVDLADAIHMLSYLFLSGPPHALGIDCLPIVDCTDTCP